MRYYQKLQVEELPEIQKEVLDYIDKNIEITSSEIQQALTTSHGSFCRPILNIEDFPVLKNWLMPRLKMPLQYINILFIPPETKFQIHLDGDDDISQKIVINVPIKNYEHATTHWFDRADIKDDNVFKIIQKNNKPPLYGYTISMVKDDSLLNPIASVTADNVTLMRGDTYHGVTNNSKEIRTVLIIRAGLDEGITNFEFEDLLDFEDLI
jgi:hypothetical protein